MHKLAYHLNRAALLQNQVIDRGCNFRVTEMGGLPVPEISDCRMQRSRQRLWRITSRPGSVVAGQLACTTNAAARLLLMAHLALAPWLLVQVF